VGQVELPFVRLLHGVDRPEPPTLHGPRPWPATSSTSCGHRSARSTSGGNRSAQQTLRTQIVRWLDDQDVVAYEQLSSYADIIMEMARRHHTRLAEP
jgi:hypothetical protein